MKKKRPPQSGSGEKKQQKKEDTRDWKGFLPLPAHGDEACTAAVVAFNYGDFKKARHLSRSLLKDSQSSDSQKIARDILNRTSTDPVILVIALAGILAVVFIFLWAVTSSHS
ncbi:hypothetical protein KKF84_09490 [Myxococcota bacterium]|nr:hypothetical protein [Myxococcota bacterium]MBU1535543.1 hypothetical protein [Myxococcota bacterium]